MIVMPTVRLSRTADICDMGMSRTKFVLWALMYVFTPFLPIAAISILVFAAYLGNTKAITTAVVTVCVSIWVLFQLKIFRDITKKHWRNA